MFKREYTVNELRRASDDVGERRGWDFSRMSTERDPVPWDFADICARYIRPGDTVLDIGTGGGERLISLAGSYASAVGVDPDAAMIRQAKENAAGIPNLQFLEMAAESLYLPTGTFDVVLTRHAPTSVPELDRVTRPGGLFLCQQVGARNMENIRLAFGTGSGTHYEDDERNRVAELVAREWRVLAQATYDVDYWVKDLPSLLFWLKAITGAKEVPADFSIDRHASVINALVAGYATPGGLRTNEHRTLLIARKAAHPDVV